MTGKPRKAAPKKAKRKAGAKAEGKRGRPSAYSNRVADEICNRLADGESLNSICRTEGMPNERTVREWALNPDHPFSPRYARAREIGAWRMADEILDIADDAKRDKVKDDNDNEKVDTDHIARSRLRVETRKWMLSKMLPKVYGDKLTTELTGKDGEAIKIDAGPPRIEVFFEAATKAAGRKSDDAGSVPGAMETGEV